MTGFGARLHWGALHEDDFEKSLGLYAGNNRGPAWTVCFCGAVLCGLHHTRWPTCDTAAPNPWTTTVGEGNVVAGDNRTVNVGAGSQIAVGNANAISLRDGAIITVANGGVVSGRATTTSGNFGTGGNTIEFRNNGNLTIDVGGQVLALGTQGSAEAVNFQGTGNTITNNGLIDANNSVAIWSQNTSGLNTVINNATGIIEAGNGTTSTVIGGSGNGALDFTNRGIVRGSINLAGGNDILRLFTGSLVTGNFSGGAGNDQIFLSGVGNATLPGNFVGFESLIKNDTGTWTLTGTITGVTVSDVQNGTLILTGNNSNYTGQVLVQPAGTLQARAQSLPPTVTNNGLVRFAQPDDGTYAGLISGAGAVEKTGAGILTLAPVAAGGNTYAGGTRINEGVVAVGADNALGAATGGLTFNGGTLQFNSQFDLSAGRAIAINAGGGTINTQGFTSTISQGTSGTGALSKTGAGSLILTGNNAHAGGTTVSEGILAVGRPDSPGAALSGGGPVSVAAGATLGGYGGVTGDVTNAGTIAVANALSTFASGPNGNFTVNGGLNNSGLIQIAGVGIGNTLTVTGDYIGQGGTIALNTFLGTDGSPSDRLIVDGGTASGTTALQVTNVGGPGASTTSDGILLIDAINGGTTASGAFSLAGPAAAGAREYFLFRGGVTGGTTQDWYLRSALDPAAPPPEPAPGTPPLPIPTVDNPVPVPPNRGATPVVVGPGEMIILYRPEVPTYSVVPPALRYATLSTLGTFHERRGEQSVLTTGDNFSAAWGRVFGQDVEQSWSGTVDPSIDGSVWGGQIGLDILRRDSGNGHRDTAGVFFGYSNINADVKGQALGWNNLDVGDMNADTTSVGAYWTHIGPSGWYVDGVLMSSWFNGSAQSDRGVGVDTDGSGITASLEGGYPIPIAQDWVLEPQGQIIFQHLDVDDQNDGFSTVNFDTDDSWTGRVGLRLQGNLQTSAGLMQPYLKANLWHGFDGTDNVRFGTDLISTDFGGTSLELGGGLVAAVTQDVSLFATADYTFDVSGENQRIIEGNVGLRVKW